MRTHNYVGIPINNRFMLITKVDLNRKVVRVSDYEEPKPFSEKAAYDIMRKLNNDNLIPAYILKSDYEIKKQLK